MRSDRRRFVMALAVIPVLSLAPLKARAFLPWILRLVFGFGIRRAGAAAALRTLAARGAIGRGAITGGARALMSRSGSTASSAALRSTRLRSALKPTRQQIRAAVGGGAAATTTSASAMNLVDVGLILNDVSDLLAVNQPVTTEIDENVSIVTVEIFGENTSDAPLNAILSVIVLDQAAVEEQESGLFAREIIGMAVIPPRASLTFVHELIVDGLTPGSYVIAPHAAPIDDPSSMSPELAFDPPAQAITLTTA